MNSNGEAICTSKKSEECGPSIPDFECLDDGVFPDPLNCKKYYYCSSDGEGGFVADEFECSNYYVFDPSAPREEYCRFTWNRYCVTANCQGKTKNILLNYPFLSTARGQVVAVCRGNKKPLIVRCAEGLTAKLDTLPVECVVNCRGAGKYEYADDSSKYYECVFTGRFYEARVKSCFRNYIFDKKSKQCVLSPFPTTLAPPTTTPVETTTTPVETTTTPVETTTTPVETTTV